MKLLIWVIIFISFWTNNCNDSVSDNGNTVSYFDEKLRLGLDECWDIVDNEKTSLEVFAMLMFIDSIGVAFIDTTHPTKGYDTSFTFIWCTENNNTMHLLWETGGFSDQAYKYSLTQNDSILTVQYSSGDVNYIRNDGYTPFD